MSRILIIDDDRALCRSLQIQLEAEGHEVRLSHSMQAGLESPGAWQADIILLDIHLPDQSGLNGLPLLLAKDPDAMVIIMTGNPDNKAVVEAMRKGAFDYLRKPLDLDTLFAMIDKAANRKKSAPEEEPANDLPPPSPDDMIGAHPSVLNVLKQIGLLSRSKVTVLIRGESGTGKELAARILHGAGAADYPFVAINCSAVVPTLLESELFGHEKGAFTGAEKTKAGKLEFAGRGTVFLDEIGDMPLDLQGKLLRVLQEEEFVRVGGLENHRLRARIVAATHCDLESMVEAGTFRQDLFYRLNVSTLWLPPLRERRQDIPLLANSLLAKIARRLNGQAPLLSRQALDEILDYHWPGNIRELENVLTRTVALSRGGQILAEDLEWQKMPGEKKESPSSPSTLAEAEMIHIARILHHHGWNITRSAQTLAISPTTLRKKIHDFNLTPPAGRS